MANTNTRNELVAISLEAWSKAEERYREIKDIDEHVAFQMNKAQFYATLATIPSEQRSTFVSPSPYEEEDNRP